MRLMMLSVLACSVGLTACSSLHRGHTVGQQMTASVGSPIVRLDIPRGLLGQSRQFLFYSGCSGSVVKVAYKEDHLNQHGEFVANTAAFQNLEYDISTSRVITFQDREIEVISADARQITYIVRKDGHPTE